MRRLLKQFLELEASSAIILFMTALVSMVWANSPLAFLHQRFIDAFLFWINEGLMAVFFLLVGLELKRGFLEDEFSGLNQVILPAVAALGGMLVPALIYLLINHGHPSTLRGWSTPVATDIAFALGVLSLFGRRVPGELKLFLLALAIFDDIGAIIIIALFYSHGLSYLSLFASASLVLMLGLFNFLLIRSLIVYLITGVLLWFCLLHSGVHPTIAGVLLALSIPDSKRLEEMLHPWVAYLVMPLFALANAGFSLHGMSLTVLTDVVVLGIICGLFMGKQAGVFGFSWLLVQSGIVKLPQKTSWLAFYGVALLCGIGFTMSLFLGTLSFQNANRYLVEVRLGVIIGSILSGIVGAMVLLIAFTRGKQNRGAA